MDKMVPVDGFFGEMMLFAVRYSLGRETYAVKDTTGYVRRVARYLHDSTLRVMARDIREQEKYGYGAHFDRYEWMDLLYVIERVLAERAAK